MEFRVIAEVEDVGFGIGCLPPQRQIRDDLRPLILPDERIEYQLVDPLRRCILSDAGIQILRHLVEGHSHNSGVRRCLAGAAGQRQEQPDDPEA